MQGNDSELSNLKNGNWFLPFNNKRLKWGSHGGNQVVGIHQDVFHRVQENGNHTVASRNKTKEGIAEKWHQTVMNDMQKRNLIPFLAQNEEKCIQHVEVF